MLWHRTKVFPCPPSQPWTIVVQPCLQEALASWALHCCSICKYVRYIAKTLFRFNLPRPWLNSACVQHSKLSAREAPSPSPIVFCEGNSINPDSRPPQARAQFSHSLNTHLPNSARAGSPSCSFSHSLQVPSAVGHRPASKPSHHESFRASYYYSHLQQRRSNNSGTYFTHPPPPLQH